MDNADKEITGTEHQNTDIVCWGLRFSPQLVELKNKTEGRYIAMLQQVERDCLAYGEGNVFTMEAEDEHLCYLYIMFRHREDCEAFFSMHKDEQVYKDGKLTLIKEPAYIPCEMLENAPSKGEELHGEA